jgi:hypothetical protein
LKSCGLRIRQNQPIDQPRTANCIIIDHFSAFEFVLVGPFLTLRDKNGWVRAKTARNLNIGVSRNRFCDFLADPDSRSFSRFGAIIMQFAVSKQHGFVRCRKDHHAMVNVISSSNDHLHQPSRASLFDWSAPVDDDLAMQRLEETVWRHDDRALR